MKFFTFNVLLLLFFIHVEKSKPEYCTKGAYPPKDGKVTEEHVINLDLPPKLRWTELGQLHKHKLEAILTQFKSVLLSVSKYAQLLIDYVDKNFEALLDQMPHPFNDELRGYAEASGVNLGELFFYNIFYEFFTVCTSVVARDDQGHIYHARNLDFGIFMGWDTQKDKWVISELLRNSSFHLRWTRGGKTLFRSVNFAGFIGVITGLKPHKFAFSLNERFNEDGGFLGLLKWVLGYRQSAWVSFVSRHIMETCESYEEARQVLVHRELIAPVYFILSGPSPHQACVITRSRMETLDVWEIGTNGYNHTDNNSPNNIPNYNNNYKASFKSPPLSNTKPPSSDAATRLYLHGAFSKKDRILKALSLPSDDPFFFVLETNYDHWTTPPFYDDRRTNALTCLNQLTPKKVNFAGLFDLLSTKPMLNKLTVYTSLMHVVSGSLESYIQDCPDPCPPW